MSTCHLCQKTENLLWSKGNDIRCSSCIINNILYYSLYQKFVMLGEYQTNETLDNVKPSLLKAMSDKKISSLMSYNENMEKRLIFQHDLK